MKATIRIPRLSENNCAHNQSSLASSGRETSHCLSLFWGRGAAGVSVLRESGKPRAITEFWDLSFSCILPRWQGHSRGHPSSSEHDDSVDTTIGEDYQMRSRQKDRALLAQKGSTVLGLLLASLGASQKSSCQDLPDCFPQDSTWCVSPKRTMQKKHIKRELNENGKGIEGSLKENWNVGNMSLNLWGESQRSFL